MSTHKIPAPPEFSDLKLDADERAAVQELTLDTSYNDYGREESDYAENARAVADWLEGLEAVDATISNTEINEHGGEVNFTLTIRQACQLRRHHRWFKHTYIHEKVYDLLLDGPYFRDPGYKEDFYTAVKRQVAYLWDLFLAEERAARKAAAPQRTRSRR